MTQAPLSDSTLAESIARTAAEVLITTRREFLGDDLRALKDAGDAAAQAHIAGRLHDAVPDRARRRTRGTACPSLLQTVEIVTSERFLEELLYGIVTIPFPCKR